MSAPQKHAPRPVPWRCAPVGTGNPGGLDKLLLAMGKAAHDFIQRKAAGFGVKVDLWNGADGLGSVLEDVIAEHRIPNKRFHELGIPRELAERAGVLKRKRRIAR